MASYRKRGNSWRAEIYLRGIRESESWPTKAAAVAWATRREAQIISDHAGGQGQLGVHTLYEALERYKREVSPKKKGERWEILRIDKMIRDMGFVGKLLRDITKHDLVAWRDRRMEEVSAASVRREMTLLSNVFEVARRDWSWCSAKPISDVSRPPEPPPRDRRISQEEIDRLLDGLGYADGVPPETMMQELAYAFLLGIETAMRKGELLGLEYNRIHLEQRFVRLEETKNGEARNVPLSRRAVQLIKLLMETGGDHGRLFRITKGSADALFRKVRDRQSIENLHFHDTRHEAITRLARRLDVLDLARMTGHKNIDELMTYYNATASEVASRLD